MKNTLTQIWRMIGALVVLQSLVLVFSSPIYALHQTEFLSVTVSRVVNSKQIIVETQGMSGEKTEYSVNTLSDAYISKPQYHVGDRLLISLDLVNNKPVASVVERDRTIPYVVLSLVFLIVVFAVGRTKGFVATIAMVVSLFILISVAIPQILAGVNPVMVSVLVGMIIIPLTFYLTHGFKQQTTLAVISTIISLVITGLLSALFTQFVGLTGYASDEASAIALRFGDSFQLSNLVIAGIIIGSMGVLDDVTISQIGIVYALSKAKPDIKNHQLFAEAMKLGRDHIGSLVNTLVLVYVGASLPMFLLIYKVDVPIFVALQRELVAEEIVRTLVSSIGIILAVPIATFLGVKWGRKRVGYLQKEKLFS